MADTCSCGFVFRSRSTMALRVHVWACLATAYTSYTGKQKIIDTAGRVEKFNQKYGAMRKTA